MINLFADLPAALRAEQIDPLLQRPGLRIERIVSCGQASPQDFWYVQEEDEWVVVLAGRGVVEFADGRRVTLERGDHLFIPARCRHRVGETSETEPTIWLAIFTPSPGLPPLLQSS